MRYLFLNNVRGFSDSFIPIVDVNFLVGENSTGKTSVLKIVKLLSGIGFWFSTGPSFHEVDLGQFQDIVSAFALDRSFFDIGLVRDRRQGGDNGKPSRDSISAFVMTFVERKGTPVLSALTYLRRGHVVRVRMGGRKIHYRIDPFSQPLDVDVVGQALFPQWLDEHRTEKLSYDSLDAPTSVPLVLLVDLIASRQSLHKKNDVTFLSAMEDLMALSFEGDMGWIAPIRTKPKYTYDTYKTDFSSEGDHIPYLIRKIFDSKGATRRRLQDFLKRVGSASGLFEDVKVRKYGGSATAPFELDVVINDKELSICNVGYGVSQSLPIIVESFLRKRNTWLAIQQPEVHLHPKAQAALGEMFFDLSMSEHKKFLIETHSDYIIDRFRTRMRHASGEKPASQVLFFERDDRGNSVYAIPILEDGELAQNQPASYREFFIREQMRVLGLD